MLTNEIKCGYTNHELNNLLSDLSAQPGTVSRHYNQVEEFFIKLNGGFSVPHLPIHHDFRQTKPSDDYLNSLIQVMKQLILLIPQVFSGLTYLFDTAEILRPCFFKLYRLEDRQYLYLVRVDLLFRPQAHTLNKSGSNDVTASYSSDILFLEGNFIPLQDVRVEDGKVREFLVEQTISNTWVGEVGRGYLVQGIWIDHELTKFFSKLFLPLGKRTYPFYPYICKYKTICQSVVQFSSDAHQKILPILHRAMKFLQPAMPEIEASMKDTSFTDDNATFKKLKEKVPDSWCEIWDSLKVEIYLNDRDMREFRLDGLV